MATTGIFRTPHIAIALLLALFLTSCKLSDLRSPEIKTEMAAENSERRARHLLHDMTVAHKNEQWAKYETYEVDFKETFFKLKFAAPFKKGTGNAKIAYVTDSYDSRLTFVDGKQAGEAWGHVDWASWKMKKGGERKWKHDKQVKFWLPTYQYFIQFPMKILEADFIRYAGSKEVDGKKCEVVFVSWKTDEPQKDIDQYLVYLDAETKRIHALEYTVRGAGGWFHGACMYKEYFEVKGVPIPKTMAVLGPKVDFENQKLFHQMEVKGLRFNAVPASDISLPKPE